MRAEITKFTDSNTGETVSKCKLAKDFQEEMDKVLVDHNSKLNAFMVMSQQVADGQSKWLEQRKEIAKTDERFKNKMKYIARKLKLSETDPWTYNLQEKCFELREPPAIKPLTSSQISSGLAEKPVGT